MSTSRVVRFRPHIARMAVVAVVGVGAVVGVPGAADVATAAEPLLATDVAATPGDTTATVSWTAATSPDVLEYGVVHRPVGFAWNPAVSVDGSLTSTTLTGLANGTTYEVAVAVRTAAGWSGLSDIVQVTPAGPSVMTAYSVPATPVLGEEFRVYFAVTVAGAPANGTIDVTFPGGSTSTQTLTDGVYSAGVVRIAPGTLTMSAVYGGAPGVLPSSATYTFTFPGAPAPQTITFDPAPPADVTFGDGPVTIGATADSGLPVTVGATGPCRLTGTSLAFTGAGDCVVTATQAGDATHEPAPPATATVTIAKAPTVTTITLLSTSPTATHFRVAVTAGGVPVTAGTLTFDIEGGAFADFPVPFEGTYAGNAGTHRTYTLGATYVGTADYLPSSTTVGIDVRLPQTIGLDAALPDSAAVVSTLPLPTETSEHLPVTSISTTPDVCTVTGSTLSLVAPGTCSVESSNPGDATRSAVLEGVSFTVTKRAQTIGLWGPPSTLTGAGEHSVWAQSSAGLPVTISASGPACWYDISIHVVDVGECVVTASSPGDALTEPASATLRIVVSVGPEYTELHVRGRVGDRAAGLAVWGWLGTGRPSTGVKLTVESTPVVLGEAVTRWDGGAAVEGVLPALGAGTHHLVLTGTSLDGTPVRAELAFGVGADGRITWIGQPGARASLAATGSGIDTTVPLAVLVLMTGVGMLGVRRRLLAGEPG